MYLTTPAERGCGRRQPGGLYLCVGLSPCGRPIEDFIIDPAREWRGGAFRAPVIVPQSEGSEINDAVMWVGAEFYPTLVDFVEEARVYGISKRVPSSLPVERLTPGKSRLILIHSRAIPDFQFEVIPTGQCHKPVQEHLCTFHNWPLSALLPPSAHRKLVSGEDGKVAVYIGSTRYQVTKPAWPKEPGEYPYKAGAFLAVTMSHFEYIDKAGRSSSTVDRVRKAGHHCEVVPE